MAEVHEANPAKLYPDLASLYKASEAVLLVHVNRNGCKLSPSGNDVITEYNATVILDFYGGPAWGENGGATARFTIPSGMVAFDQDARAAVSVRNFSPLMNGKRYLVFLRSAAGDDGRFDPGFRLTGDGVQGAFEVTDEIVAPNFHGDALWQKYRGASVATLVGDVRSFTHAAIADAAAGRPHVVGRPDIENPWDITVGKLQEAGFHLPSYMPTIWQLREYVGERLATHQQLTLTWDSLPGVSASGSAGVPCHTVWDLPLSPEFVVTGRRRGLPGASGDGIGPMLQSTFLVEIGVTASSEVRSLFVIKDPRMVEAEGYCGVVPSVTFQMRLPDDPEIKTVVFFKPEHTSGMPGVVLQKIGTLAIPTN